jgi:dTDP-4-dehydrorhamnose reductase
VAWDASLAGDCLSILEFWASPEPTIARIDATTVRDQLAETGHDVRPDDAERIASLGVRASRTPVLWERVAPHDRNTHDFSEPLARLDRLRACGVEPIVTLLHHGSGPAYTDLIDPAFPELFAEYAEAAARAFPWVRRWTPINEPLTTARFSTLYGFWYPNMRDDRAFGRALVHQARAIQLAMERIRAVIPGAELVITEDLQRFEAGDAAAEGYFAFLRERSLLAIELVAGRVVRGSHPLDEFLRTRCGVRSSELRALVTGATSPDLVAFNHYPHSERYLWAAPDGGLADVPAVYVAGQPSPAIGPLLRAAADRLQLPVAIGEVHVRGSASERVRWLAQHLADAEALRAEGVDVRAVGVWAAFGMIDWHSLLRRRTRSIEDGIYTFAGPNGVPQPTLVADALRTLASGGELVVDGVPGWWERPERLLALDALLATRDAGLPEGDHLFDVDQAYA